MLWEAKDRNNKNGMQQKIPYICPHTNKAIIILIHSYWFISLGIMAGCIGIGFIKQPLHRTGRGMTPPKQIPAEAFEIRSGIRRYIAGALSQCLDRVIGAFCFFGFPVVFHSLLLGYVPLFGIRADPFLAGTIC